MKQYKTILAIASSVLIVMQQTIQGRITMAQFTALSTRQMENLEMP